MRDYAVNNDCMKSVQIRNFFWSLFFCMQTEYSVNFHIQSEYRKMRTRKNSVFGQSSSSEYSIYSICLVEASTKFKNI